MSPAYTYSMTRATASRYPARAKFERTPGTSGTGEAGDRLGRERLKQSAHVGNRVRGDPGPAAAAQLLRERALRAHDRRRVRGEERMTADLIGMGGAVEQDDERQVGEPGARLDGIGRGDQLFHERCRIAHAPPFAWRRSLERLDRCVSRTCSGPRSSGGVKYPHSSAPSWR